MVAVSIAKVFADAKPDEAPRDIIPRSRYHKDDTVCEQFIHTVLEPVALMRNEVSLFFTAYK